MLPFIDLRNFFNITTERPAQQQIVIVTDQDSRIGIVIDKVIGNYQTVIKPLGKLYKNVQGISGATILGDGSVALILDIYKLFFSVTTKFFVTFNISNASTSLLFNSILS